MEKKRLKAKITDKINEIVSFVNEEGIERGDIEAIIPKVSGEYLILYWK